MRATQIVCLMRRRVLRILSDCTIMNLNLDEL